MTDTKEAPELKFEMVAEILPDNERTAEIMKKRAEEEEVRRQKAEELKAMREKEEKQKRMKEKNAEAERARKEKMAKDAQAKKAEEEEQMNKLEGRMLIMLNELYDQKTPFEYTITGLDLGAARARILACHIAYNNTLLSIHLARKQISDSCGVSLAKMLLTNKTLRKMELEGNLLGPKSFAEFGKVLKTNTTLKLLDLESNQLTVDGQEMYGVYQFADCLPENKTLLSLNIANNQMDEKCGSIIKEKILENDTMIDMDFTQNGFSMTDSQAIQDWLMRNKASYDAERLKEWQERKIMRTTDEKLRELYLKRNSTKEQARMEEEAQVVRETELGEKWKSFLLNTEIEKQNLIQQLMEAAVLRQSKGKKKGKKGKKK